MYVHIIEIDVNVYSILSLLLQVSSGDKEALRPDSPEPWVGDESNLQEIVITVSETEEPSYIESVTFTDIDNVDEVQIRVVKTPGDTPETVNTILVRG